METKTVHPRMTKARSRLITSQPFFGTLALHLTIEERSDIDTMATDGKSLYYNTKFLETLSDDEAEFVVAHEALHCAWLHHTRRKDRDPMLWNIACDYVINSDLVKAGFRAPPGVLLDKQYDGLGSEDVYAILDQKQQQKKKDGKGEEDGPAGQGQGKGKPGMGNCGEILDAAPGSPAKAGEQEGEWQTITKQAVAVASRLHGSTPGYLERLVESTKKADQDWREILRRFVDQSTTFDYSWSRADRRFATANFILPGIVKDGVNHIAVAIDTSGSICGPTLERFKAEVQSLLDEGSVDKISVIYCDAKVHRCDEFEAGDLVKFTPVGGGGTNFAPVWSYIGLNKPDVSAAVYFTDLYGTFGQAPDYPVLWAAYGDPRNIRSVRVPFGDVIELTQ